MKRFKNVGRISSSDDLSKEIVEPVRALTSQSLSRRGFVAGASIVAASLAATALSGCLQGSQSSSGNKTDITDVMGRTVQVNTPVQRAYCGFYLENLLAVGGADTFTKLVATSAYDTDGFFPDMSKMMSERCNGYANMTDVGSTMQDTFDVEKLLSLNPDCIILAKYQYSSVEPQLSTFENAGIPVVVINYTSGKQEDVDGSTRILGKLFGQEDRAEELLTLRNNAIVDVERRVSGVKKRKTTFNEFQSMISSYKEIGTSDTKDSFIGMRIAQAGGDDIAANAKVGEDGAQLSAEYILSKDPDCMFLISGNRSAGVTMGVGVTESDAAKSAKGMIAARPGWKDLKAVKNGDIYFLDNAIGRTLRDYTELQFMGKAMYPELFKDVDPKANDVQFMQTYEPSLSTDLLEFYHWAKPE